MSKPTPHIITDVLQVCTLCPHYCPGAGSLQKPIDGLPRCGVEDRELDEDDRTIPDWCPFPSAPLPGEEDDDVAVLSFLRSYLEYGEDGDVEQKLDAMEDAVNFERRWAVLTDAQKAVANDPHHLSDQEKERLEAAEDETEREKLLEGFARTAYFRQCAWADYFAGVEVEPPMSDEAARRRLEKRGVNTEEGS